MFWAMFDDGAGLRAGGAPAGGPPRHYLRTGGGRVIHRAGCFAALGGEPWDWAEGMTATELAADATAGRLRQCEFCMPEDMWPSGEELDQPPATLPLLDRVKLAHEHLTRAIQLDMDKARWLADQGDLRAAANALRTAWGWEQTAEVLANYVPEVLEEPGPGPAQTMPE
jgi:hypothetical protein